MRVVHKGILKEILPIKAPGTFLLLLSILCPDYLEVEGSIYRMRREIPIGKEFDRLFEQRKRIFEDLEKELVDRAIDYDELRKEMLRRIKLKKDFNEQARYGD
ncbi:MAG: hypothetical protein ACE5OY_06765 [Candidatus Bathyarchaeia archaeon]